MLKRGIDTKQDRVAAADVLDLRDDLFALTATHLEHSALVRRGLEIHAHRDPSTLDHVVVPVVMVARAR